MSRFSVILPSGSVLLKNEETGELLRLSAEEGPLCLGEVELNMTLAPKPVSHSEVYGTGAATSAAPAVPAASTGRAAPGEVSRPAEQAQGQPPATVHTPEAAAAALAARTMGFPAAPAAASHLITPAPALQPDDPAPAEDALLDDIDSEIHVPVPDETDNWEREAMRRFGTESRAEAVPEEAPEAEPDKAPQAEPPVLPVAGLAADPRTLDSRTLTEKINALRNLFEQDAALEAKAGSEADSESAEAEADDGWEAWDPRAAEELRAAQRTGLAVEGENRRYLPVLDAPLEALTIEDFDRTLEALALKRNNIEGELEYLEEIEADQMDLDELSADLETIDETFAQIIERKEAFERAGRKAAGEED